MRTRYALFKKQTPETEISTPKVRTQLKNYIFFERFVFHLDNQYAYFRALPKETQPIVS